MLSLPVAKPRKLPRVELIPPADDYSAAIEALEICELAGLDLDDWQKYSLVAGMGQKDGLWSAFEDALIVPRQNGKSEKFVGRMCVGLFTELDDPRLIMFTSHEYKTSREIFIRLRNLLAPPKDTDPLLAADPFLREQVKTVRTANGEESIELHNGRRCRFLARTSGSGRGFTGDLVILDEAYKLSGEQMGALLPTLGARPNPQVLYGSMGPFEDSEQQLAVRERALAGEPGLCYIEYSAAEEASLDDLEVAKSANPANPHRRSDLQILRERGALGDEEFAREILAMRVSSVQAVIPLIAWQKVQDENAAPSGGLVYGLDMNPERTHLALAVSDSQGRVELIDHRLASNVVEWVVEVAKKNKAPVVVDKTAAAASFIPLLAAADIEVIEYGGPDLAAASGRFHDLVMEGMLKIRTHPALDHARSGATQRPVGEAWAWGRRKSTVDISPLVAASLAVDAAVKPQADVFTPFAWT